MTCNIFSTIEKYNMISRGDSIAVGISGGADSVCLLHFLSENLREYDIVLKAVHVNHNIRGEEAKRDENFVREFCKSLNVPLTVFSVDIPMLSKELGIGEEECGRKVRYDCFARMNCTKIAVAHNSSDNCETVLFNLVRGSGLTGVSGIPPVRDNIIRPLIETSRAEIEKYCDENGLSYIVDSTNLYDDYSRNRIRLNVIPELRQINSAFESSVNNFSMIARSEDLYLNKLAEQLLEQSSKNDHTFDLIIFQKADFVLQKRVIALLLKKYTLIDYNSTHINLCLNAIMNNTKVQLSDNIYFSAERDICIEQKQDKIEDWMTEVSIDEIIETPYSTFRISLLDAENCKDKNRDCCVDFEKISLERLFFRNRRQGDRFSDPKRKITKSIKKLFVEYKIPFSEREKIAVLCCDERVVWVQGFRVDSSFSVDKNTKKVLFIEEIKNEL